MIIKVNDNAAVSCYSDQAVNCVCGTKPTGLRAYTSALYLLNSRCTGGLVAKCWTCDREVAGLNLTRGCCVPTPTQRAMTGLPTGSVNE